MDADGTLKVDDDRLKKAAGSGALDDFFTKAASPGSGFAGRIGRIADNIESNPAHYTNTGAGAVNNTGYFNYQSYNNLSNIGLLLNLMA
jgi:hypothetical protein